MKEGEYYIRPRSAAAMLPQEKTPEAYSHKKTRLRLPRERFIVAAGGLASVILVGGVGQYMADDPGYLPAGAYEMLTDFECAQISPTSEKRVDIVLNTPNDPQLLDLLINTPDLSVPIYEVPRYKEFQMKKASELGLTILNPKESLDILEGAGNELEIMEGLNNFSSNYGFKFEVFRDGSLRSLRDWEEPFSGIREDELSTQNLKDISKEAIKALSDVPVELGKLSDMHRILLVKNLDTGNSDPRKRVAAKAKPIHKSTYLDYSALEKPEYIRSIMHHELGHGIDATICGKFGFKRDGEFSELNSDEFNYEEDYLSAEDVSGVISRYGIKNVMEDKAENLERMIAGLIDVNSLEDEVKSKYIFQLIRLEDRLPGISKYLRSISIISIEEDLS